MPLELAEASNYKPPTKGMTLINAAKLFLTPFLCPCLTLITYHERREGCPTSPTHELYPFANKQRIRPGLDAFVNCKCEMH